MQTPPPLLFLFLYFVFFSVYLLFLLIFFPFFSFSRFLFLAFSLFFFLFLFLFIGLFLFFFLFQGCGLPGILKLRSATFLRAKIYVLYLDFCSYVKKRKKNQEIFNSEISSKNPLLQSSIKLTKLPLLPISKNRRNCWKKSCSKFFDKFRILYFFRVFFRKCLQNCSQGLRNN